jgi:energy-coupling factor transporter ATP-binding protein EcfA2
VPSFTLITGVNGAGKTHLLQAIAAGHVKADVAPNKEEDIRIFDWTTLVPNDTGEFQTDTVYNERDQILGWAREQRQTQRQAIQDWALNHDLTGKGQGATSSLLRLSREELGQLIANPDEAETAWQKMQEIAAPGINQMKRNVRCGLLALRVRDFEDRPFGWGQIDVFQQSFAQLFMSYFELQKQNRLRRMDEADGRTPSMPSVSDEEFLERYGEEPWEFVNRILAEARLDFEIDHPIEYSTTKFTPQLRKTTSGVELQFNELSSGERILMSFAFCLYYSLDIRQIVQRPKLLLLDEIDAPLHPSMSRQLVDTIQKSLVNEQGVNVILATHLPSTVAVAPEEAVYVMRPDEPGLHKIGKRQAIAVLTSEIPTLSIDFSGRRQVFVESQYGAERYEKLYRSLSPLIASERSLAFVAVGQKWKGGEQGGGCDNVILACSCCYVMLSGILIKVLKELLNWHLQKPIIRVPQLLQPPLLQQFHARLLRTGPQLLQQRLSLPGVQYVGDRAQQRWQSATLLRLGSRADDPAYLVHSHSSGPCNSSQRARARSRLGIT